MTLPDHVALFVNNKVSWSFVVISALLEWIYREAVAALAADQNLTQNQFSKEKFPASILVLLELRAILYDPVIW